MFKRQKALRCNLRPRHVLTASENKNSLYKVSKSCVLGQTQGIRAENASSDMFEGDIIADVAAKREPGLQLLVMDIVDTPQNVTLPETLRYLALSDR